MQLLHLCRIRQRLTWQCSIVWETLVSESLFLAGRPLNFLRDMMMLLEAVKYVFKVMETGALGDLTAEIIEPKPSWSDERLMDYIRSDIASGFHPIGGSCNLTAAHISYASYSSKGTASMLPRSANGVVDDELKVKYHIEYNYLLDELTDSLQVYGTTNLRVVCISFLTN